MRIEYKPSGFSDYKFNDLTEPDHDQWDGMTLRDDSTVAVRCHGSPDKNLTDKVKYDFDVAIHASEALALVAAFPPSTIEQSVAQMLGDDGSKWVSDGIKQWDYNPSARDVLNVIAAISKGLSDCLRDR